jgi:hypothetical protein
MDQTVGTHAAPHRRRRFHCTLVAAGAGLAIVLGGLGIASAQTGPGETTTTTTVPRDGGPRHGPGRHALGGGFAIVAQAKDRLAAKVQSGALSQARADEKLANLPQRVTNFVNRTGAPRHDRGPGPRSEGNRGPS